MYYNNSNLPSEYKSIVGNERIIFAVKSKRQTSGKSALVGGLFGSIFGGAGLAFMLPMFYTVLSGGVLKITINDVPRQITMNNIGELFFPAIICLVFVLVGLLIVYFSVIGYFRDGAWFVGTDQHMFKITPKKVESYDWEQFNGNCVTEGGVERGSLVFELRTGTMQSHGKSGSRYVPNKIEIIDIDNPHEIARLCREKIKDHDPHPANTLF